MNSNQDNAVKPSAHVEDVCKASIYTHIDDRRASQLTAAPSLVGTPGVFITAGSPMTGGAGITIPAVEVDDYIAALQRARAASSELWATEPLVTDRIAAKLDAAADFRAKADKAQAEADRLQAEQDAQERSGTNDEDDTIAVGTGTGSGTYTDDGE